LVQSTCGKTVVIERSAKMRIKWQENARCWIGTPKTDYPRFEAWRCDESAEDPWCLDMIRSPNARPIKVRQLQSLENAKEFAKGLLAEFDYVTDRSVPVTIGSDSEEAPAHRAAGIQPLPQVT